MGFSTDAKKGVSGGGGWFQNNRHQSVECFKRMTEFMTFLN